MILNLLKTFLRKWIGPSAPLLAGHTVPSTVEEGAVQLVERARQGDQNATALICEVRKSAKRGESKGRIGFRALEAYILANPVQDSLSFGEELALNAEHDTMAQDLADAFGEDYPEGVRKHGPPLAALSLPKAIVTIANGPSLLGDSGLVTDVRDTFTDGEQKAFLLGIKHGVRELDRIAADVQPAFIVGHILGTARKIQAIRRPKCPLSILSPRLGAEFGEEAT